VFRFLGSGDGVEQLGFSSFSVVVVVVVVEGIWLAVSLWLVAGEVVWCGLVLVVWCCCVAVVMCWGWWLEVL
jgi:hypothetical protein